MPVALRLCLFAALAVTAAAGQAQKVVELADDPTATLLVENEYARVWRITIPPQRSGAMHKREFDHVLVPLSHARVDSYKADGTNDLSQEVQPGAARFSSAGLPRQLRNTSTSQTLHLILVEVLRGRLRPASFYDSGTAKAYFYDRFALPLDLEKSFHLTHETPALQASDDQLTPRDSTPVHEHSGPHLVIPITDLELRSEPAQGEPQVLTASRGEVQWVPAGVKHKLTNIGREPARWISLEFK